MGGVERKRRTMITSALPRYAEAILQHLVKVSAIDVVGQTGSQNQNPARFDVLDEREKEIQILLVENGVVRGENDAGGISLEKSDGGLGGRMGRNDGTLRRELLEQRSVHLLPRPRQNRVETSQNWTYLVRDKAIGCGFKREDYGNVVVQHDELRERKRRNEKLRGNSKSASLVT